MTLTAAETKQSAQETGTPWLTVLIAAYNEQATIEQVIERVDELDFDCEILVIDDGSEDATSERVEALIGADIPGLKLLRHDRNRGKGAAVRTGIAMSTGQAVVIQDADLEYDPKDLPALLAPISEGHADVVYGTRFRGGQPQRAHMFWHYAGNRFLSLLTNVMFNTTISDMEVGYKAFRGDLIRSLPLSRDDFGIEPEITARILKMKGVRVYEVPISYFGRTYEEGKKITWRDGFRAVAVLARERLR